LLFFCSKFFKIKFYCILFFSYVYVPGYQYCPVYSCAPDQNPAHHGLVVGVTVGVTIAVLAVVFGLGFLFYYRNWLRQRQQSKLLIKIYIYKYNLILLNSFTVNIYFSFIGESRHLMSVSMLNLTARTNDDDSVNSGSSIL